MQGDCRAHNGGTVVQMGGGASCDVRQRRLTTSWLQSRATSCLAG